MYAGFGFRSFEIGDVDVLWHDGLFHLFHLVLPNHDYIAHAVSEDGLTWSRVANALFISDPGAWDDDMLWTMHVSPDPHAAGCWRMFYTGLSMRDRGRVQRIGVARSRDLFEWHKVESEALPLELDGAPYEHDLDTGRHWVSFRDPFYLRHEGRGLLLACARVDHGPLIRRGCVALAEEVAPDSFELREPLYHPRRYDDVEVPAAFELNDRWYLIGSIREDVKVHYWVADDLHGPYRNFYDNVLLPQGNYAARLCFDPERDLVLVWNFFFLGSKITGRHLLPPPKELVALDNGELRLRSYREFDTRVTDCLEGATLEPLEPLFGNPDANCTGADGNCRLASHSGFEAFLLPGEWNDYRLSGVLELVGDGKCGLVLHLQNDGDGYFVSLDLIKGIAQIRYWACNPEGGFEEAFRYEQLQAAYWKSEKGPVRFTVIAYGSYIELSLDGYVMLSLADQRQRHGRVGAYVESAAVTLDELKLEPLECPPDQPYRSQDPMVDSSQDAPEGDERSDDTEGAGRRRGGAPRRPPRPAE